MSRGNTQTKIPLPHQKIGPVRVAIDVCIAVTVDAEVAFPLREVGRVDIAIAVEIPVNWRFGGKAIPPSEGVVLCGSKLLVPKDSNFVFAIKWNLCKDVLHGGYAAK